MNFYYIRRAMGALMGFTGIVSPLVGILTYVLTALSLYTIAQRRGINNPWLAWIPIANIWVLGSLSDQYRYVVRGEIQSKRKALIALNIAMLVLSAVITGAVAAILFNVFSGMLGGYSQNAMLQSIMAPSLCIAGVSLPLMGVGIALVIIRYMALYDLYASCDPDNKMLFLVLSILIGITQPIFLFVCRNKDFGMPPRRDQFPQKEPAEPTAESDSEDI